MVALSSLERARSTGAYSNEAHFAVCSLPRLSNGEHVSDVHLAQLLGPEHNGVDTMAPQIFRKHLPESTLRSRFSIPYTQGEL